MAVVLRWSHCCRAVTTVRRVRRHVPLLNRFLSDGPHSGCDKTLAVTPERNLAQHNELESFWTDSVRELHDESQILKFLEEQLERTTGKRHIAHLLSSDTNLRTVFCRVGEDVVTYSTETVVALLELFHSYGIKNEDVLVLLGKELRSRIDGMSFHSQQRALQVLWKLNLNRLCPHYRHLDMTSFINALKHDVANSSTVGYTVYLLKDQIWSDEFKWLLQDYVTANASNLDLRAIYQVLSVMTEKDCVTKSVLKAFAKAVANILTQDLPERDRWEVWGSHYPHSLCNLLSVFAKLRFYDEELYVAFASLVEGTPDLLLLSPRFLSSLSRCCAKARFYSESLMCTIADHSMREMTKFPLQDLGLLIYGFGALNCAHHELFNAAVDKIIDDPCYLHNAILCWITAWVAMVFEQYPEKLLSGMLTDDYLKCKLTFCITDYHKSTMPRAQCACIHARKNRCAFIGSILNSEQ